MDIKNYIMIHFEIKIKIFIITKTVRVTKYVQIKSATMEYSWDKKNLLFLLEKINI